MLLKFIFIILLKLKCFKLIVFVEVILVIFCFKNICNFFIVIVNIEFFVLFVEKFDCVYVFFVIWLLGNFLKYIFNKLFLFLLVLLFKFDNILVILYILNFFNLLFKLYCINNVKIIVLIKFDVELF